MLDHPATQAPTDISARAFGQARLRGVLSGRDDGRPGLVLLHGLTFDSRMWEPASAALRRIDRDRQVLILDLPGHGGSPAQQSYGFDAVGDAISHAVTDAGLVAPILVGHSISALIATIYATRHAVSGVVNVDQSLETSFARTLHANRQIVNGPGFPRMWEGLLASMHIDALPDDARRLLSTEPPSQELVVGYWREALHRQPDEIDSMLQDVLRHLKTDALPYLVVAGHDYEPAYTDWLHRVLPQATISTLPESGHFPQLAHSETFARLLASTGEWARR
jgi:pimeloyl-ACP methyl ester carboxylesterase